MRQGGVVPGWGAAVARWVGAAVVGVVAVMLYAGPAQAHGADAPVAVGYVVRVESVSVAGVPVAGVTVRAVEGGARLELENRSRRSVVVLGLQGEEFLRVGPDGVFENRRSPTLAASRTVGGTAGAGDASAAPEWRRVAGEPRVRWHDERARELPARQWSIPLLVDGRDSGVVRGTVSAAPIPETGWWWAGAVVLAVAVGLGWRWGRVLAAVAIVAGIVTGGWIVGSAVSAASPADGAGVQVLARLWPLVTAAGLIVAGGVALVRRVDIVLAIAGACAGVMVGLANASVFRYGVLAGPGFGRLAVLVAIGAGVGLAVAGGIRWYHVAGEGQEVRVAGGAAPPEDDARSEERARGDAA